MKTLNLTAQLERAKQLARSIDFTALTAHAEETTTSGLVVCKLLYSARGPESVSPVSGSVASLFVNEEEVAVITYSKSDPEKKKIVEVDITPYLTLPFNAVTLGAIIMGTFFPGIRTKAALAIRDGGRRVVREGYAARTIYRMVVDSWVLVGAAAGIE